jgi:2',3'-cyclic-nucleotide 2'-phosphodiesterase (5'-nucleotidase family)
LYTSDEHGWVAPVTEKGKTRAGAAGLLARWKQDEKHCVPTSNETCEASSTLALSGGDNWTGPALSSYFQGEVAAESMRRLGYAASALGNHELDFGRAAFVKNHDREGFPYLAANVSPVTSEGGVSEPWRIFSRSGVKIGVIGLSTRSTPSHGMRANYDGLRFDDETAALERDVPAVYAAGADVVVVIAHVCADELSSIVAKHPEWKLAFAGAGHCHRLDTREAAGTPVIEPGSFLQKYIRVTLRVDRSSPTRERLMGARSEVVDLSYPEGAPPPATPDAEMNALVETWQAKTNAVLGEVIGHTKAAIEPDSQMMGSMITDAWRVATHADVAMLNRFATRQAIPAGPISLQTIYSVMPFDNRLVTVKITGAQLIENIACCGGFMSGVRPPTHGKKELTLLDGKPIDPAKIYTVTITDYAYFGGSGSTVGKYDKAGVFGVDWREPVIQAIRARKSSSTKGIDEMLAR